MTDRRTFLKGAAGLSGAAALLRAQTATDWTRLIGIQLTVVRDEQAKDLEGTIAKLAEIGYKVINPIGFSGMEPMEYRAMLDRHGVIATQVDLGFSTGVDMEKDLEACQIVGIKYAEPRLAGGGGRGRGPGGPGGPGGGEGRGRGPGGPGGPGGGGGRGRGPAPQTLEMAKQTADDYNRYGHAAKKFGMKVIFHNHIEHFEKLVASDQNYFDVFMAETDPEVVSMEFDLGYTAIAGQNIPKMIKRYAGRFQTWDIRDAFGIRNADTIGNLTPNQRRGYTYAVPVGLGEVDFKTYFASAQTAGLKYFFVVQDNSTAWGDSMAVARLSYRNLAKILA